MRTPVMERVARSAISCEQVCLGNRQTTGNTVHSQEVAMKWWLTCMKKYVTFDGRARRKEYWIFALLNGLFAIIAVLLDNLLGTAMEDLGYGVIYILFGLAILLPTWAVVVRRLHDVGKSGWWIFISLIPLVGGIWLFILMVTDSQPGDNQYGPNPKMDVLTPQ
jgi:uncharacterized membrane protein YhaH (DUF805 family)